MSDKVLILDDSLTVRMDLAGAFEEAGFVPIPTGSIAEAREAFAREAPRIAVLDVLLPDGDGIDFLTELRASPSGAEMAILVLSTEADVKDRIRGLKTGADEYVGKPYDAKHVVGRARELLRVDGVASDQTSILVVDDSPTFREALREAFTKTGYRVLTATTGEEGLLAIADRRPSVVVVDGVLPGMDGATLIRRVRLDAALRGIPCLLLTGSEERDAELGALEAGADAFVRKDEDIEVILAKVAAVLRGTAASRHVELGSLLGPHKILAVDDSTTYLNSLADTLRGEGYDVALARSGEEALDLLAVQQVDCILLDLMMPGIGGREACHRIKSAPILRDIPLILLTAVEDRNTMLDGLSAGADDYIAKSSEFEVLKARVRAQIRRKQFEDENRRIREELLRNELDAAEARAARELAETRALLVGELERKNNELEAFSYSVSHDLRAPLRAIDGFSRALIEDCSENLDGSGLNYLNRVRAAAQRMGELIDDMLQLSRVTRADLNRRKIDVSALAREVAADLQRQHPDRKVEFNIEDGLEGDADARLLRIVIENLFGNAWKFTRDVEQPKVELGLMGDGASYFIRDNGAGFDMKRADKLFRPFQRLHTEEEFPGTGVGLATIYRVIDRHGGRVWAEAEVGQGATFYFTLPPPKANLTAQAA
jgi:two-component system, NtrC family, sensor kinase